MSEDQLDKIRMARGDKYYWSRYFSDRGLTGSRIDINGNCKLVLAESSKNPLMFQCLKCEGNFFMEGCLNCGVTFGLYFHRGLHEPTKALICGDQCRNSFSSWHCLKCGYNNPFSMYQHNSIVNTIFHLERGCFIATAGYGSYSAPEVIVLREFRDKVLRANYFGRVFMNIYYLVSPPIADFISTKESLKKLIKTMLLKPVVKWLRI